MITIDPVDDEVIRRDKIDRQQVNRERRSNRRSAGVQANGTEKKRTGLLALVAALLLGKRDEEVCDEQR